MDLLWEGGRRRMFFFSRGFLKTPPPCFVSIFCSFFLFSWFLPSWGAVCNGNLVAGIYLLDFLFVRRRGRRALELDSIIILVCVHFLSLSLSLSLSDSLSDSRTVLAHSRGRLFFMISSIHSPFFSFGHIISLSLLCVLRASLPRAEIERRRKKGGRWTSGLRSKRDRHKKGSPCVKIGCSRNSPKAFGCRGCDEIGGVEEEKTKRKGTRRLSARAQAREEHLFWAVGSPGNKNPNNCFEYQ